MDIVEKKLIEFMQESTEIMNVTYSNKLAYELLTIIQLEHRGLKFKGKSYLDKQKLHYNISSLLCNTKSKKNYSCS